MSIRQILAVLCVASVACGTFADEAKAKEAESELKYLADRKKFGGGFGALIKKPAEDDILTMSRKARRKANKLERKAAKLERKLRKIEKKQIKALKKIENQ